MPAVLPPVPPPDVPAPDAAPPDVPPPALGVEAVIVALAASATPITVVLAGVVTVYVASTTTSPVPIVVAVEPTVYLIPEIRMWMLPLVASSKTPVLVKVSTSSFGVARPHVDVSFSETAGVTLTPEADWTVTVGLSQKDILALVPQCAPPGGITVTFTSSPFAHPFGPVSVPVMASVHVAALAPISPALICVGLADEDSVIEGGVGCV
jgi:hypothetical protein